MEVNVWIVSCKDNQKLNELNLYFNDTPRPIILKHGLYDGLTNIYCVKKEIDFKEIAYKIYKKFIIMLEGTYIFKNPEQYNNNYDLYIHFNKSIFTNYVILSHKEKLTC